MSGEEDIKCKVNLDQKDYCTDIDCHVAGEISTSSLTLQVVATASIRLETVSLC
jgi:hypothetical protein